MPQAASTPMAARGRAPNALDPYTNGAHVVESHPRTCVNLKVDMRTLGNRLANVLSVVSRHALTGTANQSSCPVEPPWQLPEGQIRRRRRGASSS